MIIDFHTHVFPDDVVNDRSAFMARDAWFAECYANPKSRAVTADTLVDSMDQAGIDRAVICGFAWADRALCAYHNDYLVDAIHRYPGRLVGLAAVQPAAGPGAASDLHRAVTAGLRGVGEINADAQRFDLLDFATLAPLVNTLVELNLPMLLHASEPVGHSYPGKGTAFPSELYQFIRRFPGLKLICAHWGGGLPFYELMPEVAEAARDVSYDTAASSLLYDKRVFKAVIDIVGPSKVLFGTDYPLLRQDRFLATVRALNLPPAWLDAILGDNAARMLKDG